MTNEHPKVPTVGGPPATEAPVAQPGSKLLLQDEGSMAASSPSDSPEQSGAFSSPAGVDSPNHHPAPAEQAAAPEHQECRTGAADPFLEFLNLMFKARGYRPRRQSQEQLDYQKDYDEARPPRWTNWPGEV